MPVVAGVLLDHVDVDPLQGAGFTYPGEAGVAETAGSGRLPARLALGLPCRQAGFLHGAVQPCLKHLPLALAVLGWLGSPRVLKAFHHEAGAYRSARFVPGVFLRRLPDRAARARVWRPDEGGVTLRRLAAPGYGPTRQRPTRIFIHRCFGGSRPYLPHTGRAAALSAELACKRGWLADLRFLGELAFDSQKEKRNYERPPDGKSPCFGGITVRDSRSGAPGGYQMTWPPSTRRSTPVTNDAALLSRKMTGPTMSSGWAFRPRGVSLAYPSIASRCSGRWVIGV